MTQESNNQSNSQSQLTSSKKTSRPKVNPDKTINYRQDGADQRQKKS